jgi:hypothetical protein
MTHSTSQTPAQLIQSSMAREIFAQAANRSKQPGGNKTPPVNMEAAEQQAGAMIRNLETFNHAPMGTIYEAACLSDGIDHKAVCAATRGLIGDKAKANAFSQHANDFGRNLVDVSFRNDDSWFKKHPDVAVRDCESGTMRQFVVPHVERDFGLSDPDADRTPASSIEDRIHESMAHAVYEFAWSDRHEEQNPDWLETSEETQAISSTPDAARLHADKLISQIEEANQTPIGQIYQAACRADGVDHREASAAAGGFLPNAEKSESLNQHAEDFGRSLAAMSMGRSGASWFDKHSEFMLRREGEWHSGFNYRPFEMPTSEFYLADGVEHSESMTQPMRAAMTPATTPAVAQQHAMA